MPLGQLEFADGTILDGGAGYTDHQLWLWIDGTKYEFAQIAGMMFETSKTQRIVYHLPYGETQEWAGYTKVSDLKIDTDSRISVRLLPGGAENV